MKEGYSIRQLVQQSKHSNSKLYRILDYWLAHKPPQNTDMIQVCRYGMFDGTFLHRPNSIVVLMNAKGHRVTAGKYGIRENSIPQLKIFFEPLIEQGLTLKSCTVDGNPQVIRTLRELWPEIIIQRCLVHIQRQGLMWCRQKPKRTDAKHLRKIFLRITYIRDKKDRDKFLNEVMTWEKRFGFHVAVSREKGRVFSDLKRARSMLLNALPDMFHYLEDSNIPHTTNGLEGYFSRLKRSYRNHRGLSPYKRRYYFMWYFFLCPR